MVRRIKLLAVAWIAAAVAIGTAAFTFDVTHLPFVLASLGGSAVILFGMPESDMAQPRSFLGGHLIATAVGIAFLNLFGAEWWVMAAAVATALTLMQVTRTIHSPAGADPIIVILNHAGWSFLAMPLALGLAILLAVVIAFNRIAGLPPYPRRWV